MKKLLLLLTLLASACVLLPPPDPTPPPPYEQRIGVTIRGTGGVPLADARATLTPDDGTAPVVGANDGGRVTFIVHSTGGAWLDVEAEQYLKYHERTLLDPELADIYLHAARVDLPQLVVRGRFLGLANGQYFTAIEASDFCLYARYLNEGEDAIAPVLKQRADLGFNMLRVWTHMRLSQYGICDMTPQSHPQLYDRIGDFTDLVARYGMYVEFTAYTGEPGRRDEAHYPKLVAALTGRTNVIIELVNENDQGGNTVDVTRFFPAPFLSSHGSNGSQAWPVDPPWTYETYHTNSAFEWWRKVGHNAMEIADDRGRPVISNENTRYPDNDNSVAHAYDAAASAALLTAGSCFHSVSGKRSTLWVGAELDAANAWATGARRVPLKCQDGRYVRRDDLLNPGLLRVYERRLPTPDDLCIVPIRN